MDLRKKIANLVTVQDFPMEEDFEQADKILSLLKEELLKKMPKEEKVPRWWWREEREGNIIKVVRNETIVLVKQIIEEL